MHHELMGLLLGGFGYHFGGCWVGHGRHAEWLHPLVQGQGAAGWEQLPCGRFSKLWAELHEKKLIAQRKGVTEKNSGKSLIRKLSLKLWILVHGVW